MRFNRSSFLLLLYCFFSVFAIITLSSSFEIVCQKQEDCGILSWYRVPLSLAPCKQLITFRFVYILFTVKCAFHSEFLTSIRNIRYEIGLGLNSVIVSPKFPGGKNVEIKKKLPSNAIELCQWNNMDGQNYRNESQDSSDFIRNSRIILWKKAPLIDPYIGFMAKNEQKPRERNENAKFYDSMMFRSFSKAVCSIMHMMRKICEWKKQEIFEIKSEIGMVVWCFERYEVLWHFNMHNMRSTFDVLHISCAL